MVELREGSALLHLIRSGPAGAAASIEGRDRRPPLGDRRPSPADRRPPLADRRMSAGGPQSAGVGPRSGEGSEPTVTCGFCGRDFVEDRSQATCQACPLSRACGMMRCPHCGYENAREPGWITKLKEWIG